jgi:hypothetical protein
MRRRPRSLHSSFFNRIMLFSMGRSLLHTETAGMEKHIGQPGQLMLQPLIGMSGRDGHAQGNDETLAQISLHHFRTMLLVMGALVASYGNFGNGSTHWTGC